MNHSSFLIRKRYVEGKTIKFCC